MESFFRWLALVAHHIVAGWVDSTHLLSPMKIQSLLLLFAFLFTSCQSPPAAKLTAGAPAAEPRFPAVVVKNLEGTAKSFPTQFPGGRTLLFIAFERVQQDQIDEWSKRLALNTPAGAPWLEMPVINDPGAFARWFIDGGMRSGIPDPAIRERVFTIYTPRDSFVKRLGLPNASELHLAVADRGGRILTYVSGAWTAAKERQLRNALKQ
jgi:hypothetical protein